MTHGGRGRRSATLVPRVLTVLVRRGADFATAEDAVQEALIRALAAWADGAARRPDGWLITVAWRALHRPRPLGRRRAASRELRVDAEPPPGRVPQRRRHAAPLLPVRAPGPDVVVGGRADPARGRRPHHPPDRRGLPGARGDDGPAHQPRQAHGRPGRRRSSRRRAHRDAGAVPRLQRGLLRRRRPRGRGDPADPAAGGGGRRSRGRRAARPDAPAPRPPPQPHPARREPRAARRSGPQPVGHRPHRRGRRHRCRLRSPAIGSASTRRRRRSPRCTPTRRGVEETDWVQIVEWYDELLRFADTPDRPAQPGGGGRRGRRRAGGARRAGRGRRARPAPRRGRRVPPREERRPASSPPASTPTPPAARPTSPSATTRRARPPASTSTCGAPRARDARRAARASSGASASEGPALRWWNDDGSWTGWWARGSPCSSWRWPSPSRSCS